MPQFNAYPALQAQTFDLPSILQQAEQLKSQRTTNRLREFQMQQAQGEVQRQGQLRGLMPGVMAGDQGALGQAAALDPSMLSELLKIPKAKRDQAKAEVEQIGNLLQAVETAPPVQRPQIYAMARQQYATSGADMSDIPETYDPGWVQTKLAEAGKLMAVLDQAEKATPPAGYRRAEGGLEDIPGGPADPAQVGRLAAAKREPEKPTERQQKIDELLARGLSQQQAEDIASGRVRVSTDPVTGAIRLVNVATGRMTQPRGQLDIPKKTRAEMAGQVQSIEGLLAKMPSLQEAIEKGVGLVPAAKEFGGKVLGQLPTGSVDIPGIGEIGTGEAAVDPEVVQARTQLRIFREDVIAAFRKSGRVPVQEQKRILQFVDKLGVLNSAPDAKFAFQQLEQELRRVRDTYNAQLGGQTPPGAPSSGERPQIQTDADYNALPSDTEFVAPDGTIRRKP